MSPRLRNRVFGGVLPLLSVVIAGGAIVLASLSSLGVWSGSREQLEAPDAYEVAAALARSGVSAETLAAAGVSDREVAQLVTYVQSHLDADTFGDLEQADTSFKAAREHRDSLARHIRGGKGTDDDVTALRVAEQALNTAKLARQQLLDGVRTAAFAALTNTQTATLNQIQSNERWDLPVQYRVIERTEREWVELRNALANSRIAPRMGEERDADCSNLIIQCNADSDVAAAKAAFDNRFAQLTVVFEQALGLRG